MQRRRKPMACALCGQLQSEVRKVTAACVIPGGLL